MRQVFKQPAGLWLLGLVLAVLLVSGCGDGGTASTTTGPSSSTTERSSSVTETNPKVIISTSQGDMTLELDAAKAPLSVQNFLDYAREGYFDGTIFHRVIPGFMIQGGGFTPDMNQKSTKAAIKNEAGNGLKNLRGTIAMARTNVVDSATSQFFINSVDNAALDHRDDSPAGFGYAVFGKVVEGMETLDAISGVATTSKGMYQDVPAEPVVIEKVTLAE